MRNQKGFTVIEMAIVMVVIAILAGVSIPVYVGIKPVIRLSGATRQIMEDLMWARMQAINQNNKFIITYDGNYKYSILDDNDNNGTSTAGAGESIVTKYFRDDRDKLNPDKICGPYYDVTYSSSNTNALIFHPRGNASNLTTITLSNKSGTKTVSVAITGRVKKQ